MNVVIHDLDNEQFEKQFCDIKTNTYIISDTGSIQNCIGCFGCWIKTPGKCVIKDGYDNLGEVFSKADKVIIISKCIYGGYSPFVKTVLERCISYLLPFFTIINNETHHKARYKNRLQLLVYFYGKHITAKEMLTAQNLVKANSKNFNVYHNKVSFFESINQLCMEVNFL